MTRYRVVASREGDWWLLTVPELDEATTQVRRLDQAKATARDLIATWLDVAPDSFDVEVYVPGLSDHAAVVRRQWEAVRAAEAEAARHTRKLARDAAQAGLSVREIGALLGVSHQRAHQLLAS